MPNLFHWQILAEHQGCAYHSLRQVIILLLWTAALSFPDFVNKCYDSMIHRHDSGHVVVFFFFLRKKGKKCILNVETPLQTCWIYCISCACEAKKHIFFLWLAIIVSSSQTPCSTLLSGKGLNITFFLQNGWTFYSPVFSPGALVSSQVNYPPWAPSAWIPTLAWTSTKKSHVPVSSGSHTEHSMLYVSLQFHRWLCKTPGENKSQGLAAHLFCEFPQTNCTPTG